jgi:hypothetical protein
VDEDPAVVVSRLALLGAFFMVAPLTAAVVQADNAKSPVDSVTVEAQRQALEKQVAGFVSGAMVHYQDQSLARWDKAVCPLVAGMPRDQGEFMLARLSQIAANAGAQLAPEKCTANLFIIVTRQPQLLLKKWHRRDKRMFNDINGVRAINRFLDTARPIRVWYNVDTADAGGASIEFVPLPGGISSLANENFIPIEHLYDGGGGRVQWNAVGRISSVIVVADSNRLKGLTFGQLADYVGMIGYAQVRPDSDIGSAPSILHLFAKTSDPPQGLSNWDEALLKSLYGTRQTDVMQLSEMKTAVLHSIAP